MATTIDLYNLDGTDGFRLDGAAEGDDSGRSISNAGDINGDGFDDSIIGAPRVGPTDTGSSYIVFGKASGFEAAMSLSSLDGSNGFSLDGNALSERERDYTGGAVSDAGDVNGDGFDDVIVGALGASPNGRYSGSSYVIFGKASGFDAAMDLTSLNGSNGFRLDGATQYDRAGTSVSTAGDINGDGFDDLIIGAPYADGSGYSSGFSYMVFGKASGFDAKIDLSSLDSNSGFRLDGGAAGDNLGVSVSSAGDVKSDGFDDLLVGAHGADPNGEDSGSSYLIFGRSDFGTDKVVKGTPEDDTLKGTLSADIFDAFGGNDTLFGYGGADILNAGAGNDTLNGGAGSDTMNGAWGNDTYFVDSMGDKIIEKASQGKDQVNSNVTYTLSDNVENMTLTGIAAINATGNSLANIITGNNAANELNRNAGNDTRSMAEAVTTLLSVGLAQTS